MIVGSSPQPKNSPSRRFIPMTFSSVGRSSPSSYYFEELCMAAAVVSRLSLSKVPWNVSYCRNPPSSALDGKWPVCGRYYFVDDRCLSSSSSRCLCCFGLSYLRQPLSSLRISIIIYRRIVGIGRVSNNQRVSLLRLLFNKLRNQASQQNFSYLQTNAAHPPNT